MRVHMNNTFTDLQVIPWFGGECNLGNGQKPRYDISEVNKHCWGCVSCKIVIALTSSYRLVTLFKIISDHLSPELLI